MTIRHGLDPVGNYDYDAFGNKIGSTGTTPNNYLYRGEQYDSDLGLYYLRARYYNPATGRFMSRDPEDGKPINPKTLHKYLYAGGDPVNAMDPTGREAVLETGFIDTRSALETAVISKFGLAVALCFYGVEASVFDLTEEHISGRAPVDAGAAILGCYLTFFP
jgi:RHS repeat-associated protein